MAKSQLLIDWCKEHHRENILNEWNPNGNKKDLSQVRISHKSLYGWICAKGHEYYATVDSVIRNNPWRCGECSEERSKELRLKRLAEKSVFKGNPFFFAVIDVETDFFDNVFSTGVVIVNTLTMEMIDGAYFVVIENKDNPGMFSSHIELTKILMKQDTNYEMCKKIISKVKQVDITYQDMIERIRQLFQKYDCKVIGGYNAHFDKRHLPELNDLIWFDIMPVARNFSQNKKLNSQVVCKILLDQGTISSENEYCLHIEKLNFQSCEVYLGSHYGGRRYLSLFTKFNRLYGNT